METTLHPAIAGYFAATNAHNTDGMIASFADDAVVADENHEYRGAEAIRGWMNRTIAEYKMHFELLEADANELSVTVHGEVSGTFPGSPIPMHYHFTLAEDKITSLRIDGQRVWS